MKFDAALVLLTLFSYASANVIADAQLQTSDIEIVARDTSDSYASEEHDLWKRKGGGGRGGRGSGGGGGGGGGGGRSTPSPRRGADGGRSVQGFGPQPRYGPGGRFYPGGAAAPYRAGSTSPVGGLVAFGLIGFAAVAFWPGSWHYGNVRAYRFNNEYTFYNVTEDANQTKPVMCGCEDNFPCGCDESRDRTERDAVLDDLIGNGSYAHLDKEFVDVGEYEGRSTILLNGTLPYDTSLRDPEADDSAADGMRVLLENLGWWPLAAAAMGVVLVA